MALIDLPSGDFLDPECNKVGGIFYRAPTRETPKPAVVIMTQQAMFVVEYATEEEAQDARGAIAARLGWAVPKELQVPPKAMRQ